MTEAELQALLLARFPREDAACEWKEFKSLTHAVAATTGTQASYTRSKGLDKAQLKQFVLEHLRTFQAVAREDLDELLGPLLPEGLAPEQKVHRVKNLLTEMRREDRSIEAEGQGRFARWRLASAASFNPPPEAEG